MDFPPRHSNGSNGPTNYLKLKDGESVTGILRGNLYSYWQIGFGLTAQLCEPGQGKERFRANFVIKEGDKYVAKVWEFGPKIYDMLSALSSSGWDLKNTLLTISRSGTTKENTKYTVTPNKKEPPAATMKLIEKLELNALEHKEQGPPQQLVDYAPGEANPEVPF